MLADRLGRRLTLIIATSAFGLLGCAIMLMNSLELVIATRFLIGLATGTIAVCLAAVIADNFEGSAQGKWIGYTGGVAAFAIIAVIPLTGYLTDIRWEMGFLPYLLALPILGAILLGVPAHKAGAVAATEDAKLSIPFNKIPISALCLGLILGTLQAGTGLYWPFRLQEVGVTSAAEFASYVLPQILVIGMTTMAYGHIRRFLSIPQVFIIAGLLSALGLILIAAATSPAWILVGLTIEGLGIGAMTPNLTVLALALTDEEFRGRILGLIKSVIYGSPFITQFILQPLNLLGGSTAAVYGIAAMSIGMAIAVIFRWLGQPGKPAGAVT